MLKSESNKIYRLISKHNFTQELDFSHCERNTPINTADVINVNKTKSKELFIKTFFNILAWILQFTVIAKLLLIADFFNPQDRDWFTLNCCNSRTQIHKVTSRNRDSRSDRDYWSYSDDFGFWEVVAWSSDSLELGWHSTSSCNGIRLTVLELL